MTRAAGPADVAIVGAGLVGLATAWRLVEARPGLSVVVLEKEPAPARHQSGRNSGVVHSGLYYAPGSLKAQTCREGRQDLVAFCEQEGVALDPCGKVVVAVTEAELPALQVLAERGRANGVRCEMVGPSGLAGLEPHAAGVAALHVPDAGIVDFPAVALRLADRVRAAGGEVRTGVAVERLETTGSAGAGVRLGGPDLDLPARVAVSCAGLHADRLARASGREPPVRIVPFRGEYLELLPHARELCRNLIYPVPDPRFPFLGVHLTRRLDGSVEAGPNAVLALAREGYGWTDVRWRDLADSLAWPGFRRLARRHWRSGAAEIWRSLSRRSFAAAARHLVPEVRESDFGAGRSGVRAQAVDPTGRLSDDFVLHEDGPVLHVLNAPSPAATACLAIGRRLAERALALLDASAPPASRAGA